MEIIKPAKFLSPETERALLRHTRNPLVNELVPLSEFWDAEKTISEIKSFYGCISDQIVSKSSDEENVSTLNDEGYVNGLPDILSKLVDSGDYNSYALSALGGTLFYLKQAFMDETLLRFAKFELLPCYDFSGCCNFLQKPYMVLDAAALENLEIFENSRNGGLSGYFFTSSQRRLKFYFH